MRERPFDINIELSVVILCYRAGKRIYNFVKKTIWLLEECTPFWEIVLVGNYFENSDDETPEIVRDIASRFNTIQQISHLLNRRTKIGIISSDTLSYNLIIQSLFHYQNIDFIYQLDRNEFITRIDTYFMRIVLTLLFDLEMIEGIDFFREMDYYVYIASCEEEGSCQKHIDNIDTMFKQDRNAKIFLVTTERAEQLSLEKKKYLFQESEKRKNLKLMISVGDVFRTLDNAIYLILSDILELRKIILSQNKG